MSEKNNHFKIGLFVLAAVGLLVAGLLAFGARSYFEKKLTFQTFIQGDVAGLSIGSPVKLRGVPVGQVTRIEFTWNEYPQSTNRYVVVEFQVKGDVIPANAERDVEKTLAAAAKIGLRAIVKGQGITGTSVVSIENLDPHSNPPPPLDFTPRYLYLPSAPSQFTKMLDSIEETLRSFRQVDFIAISAGLTNAISAAGSLVVKLDRLDLHTIITNANDMLVEVKVAAAAMHSTLEEIRTTINEMGLARLGGDANALMLGLQESNRKLQTVLDHVGAVPLGATVADIREAVITLNNVLQELKQYPSGFIFGDPPPPAKSVRTPGK